MWFYRKVIRIPRTARKTNNALLMEANTQRRILTHIRKRQSRIFGHIMRRGCLVCLVTMGKIRGKRDRGRQREKMLESMAWNEINSNIDTMHKRQGIVESHDRQSQLARHLMMMMIVNLDCLM